MQCTDTISPSSFVIDSAEFMMMRTPTKVFAKLDLMMGITKGKKMWPDEETDNCNILHEYDDMICAQISLQEPSVFVQTS